MSSALYNHKVLWNGRINEQPRHPSKKNSIFFDSRLQEQYDVGYPKNDSDDDSVCLIGVRSPLPYDTPFLSQLITVNHSCTITNRITHRCFHVFRLKHGTIHHTTFSSFEANALCTVVLICGQYSVYHQHQMCTIRRKNWSKLSNC